MSFHIGQKVVCIITPDDWMDGDGNVPIGLLPQKGEICVIRGFGSPFPDGEAAICLERYRGCFAASGFRPLVEKSNEASMSMLKKLLQPQKELA
jgi:hypothetical protein